LTRNQFFGTWLPMEAPKNGSFSIRCADGKEYTKIVAIIPVTGNAVSIRYKASKPREYVGINVDDIVAIDIFRKKR